MKENFMNSLEIMWKGMLGIFVVILLITFIVLLLTWISNISSKKKNQIKE